MAAGGHEDVPEILVPVAEQFRRRIKRYGAGPRGVCWRSAERQQLRFRVLAAILDGERGNISVGDLGCGYGALFDFLDGLRVPRVERYVGYDICAEMLRAARRRIDDPRAAFIESSRPTADADYGFAAGTYNLKHDADDTTWNAYVKTSLAELWARSRRGLAFNMLSIDSELRQKNLYYGDPSDFMEFCARALSPRVTLLDNHPLADWTILVRR